METLARIFAPRSGWDFALRFFGIIALINLCNPVVARLLGEKVDLLQTNLVATIVGTPFVFGFLLVLRHQTELQDRLRRLADTDQLTGLPNRRAFQRLAGGTQLAGDMVLMILDIDHFKLVNDRFGHDAGDRCLQLVAERLGLLVARRGMVARLGGEEFGILLPGGSRHLAATIGAVATSGFDPPLPVAADGMPERLRLSVGAVEGRAGEQLSEAMRQADRALYAAKQAGRGRMVFADPFPVPERPVQKADLRDPAAITLRTSLSHQ